MRWLAPTLACLALAAGEPLTSTPWDVRKEAGEVFEELARSGGGDRGELLSRARELILAHGEQLVTTAPNEAAPISQALGQRLAAAGLGERFAAELAPAAERRSLELAEQRVGAAAWAAFARSVPGTPAGTRAWRRAADLAWDHGMLRLYLDVAEAAGEAAAEARKPRLAATAGLLATPTATLPGSLDGLEWMWRVALERTPVAPAAGSNRRRSRPIGPLGRPGASAFGDGAVAVSDGLGLLVIDHLVGAPLGSRLQLGNRPLPAHISRPEPVPGGAVAIGLSDGRLVLVCVDAAGNERWRYAGEAEVIEAVGAPLAVDALLCVPYRASGEDRLELRVLAVSARDGRLVWDTAVGQVAQAGWNNDGSAAPALVRHARGLAVCSNAGTFALLGSDGGVRRLWTYPTRPELDIDGTRRGRRGLAASDGTTAVATPADHAGLVLVLGPDDKSPRAYRGDGADGDVLAVHGGDALLAGRQVALIDTNRLRLRWSAPLRLPEPQGLLSPAGALVSGTDQLALLARPDGTMRSYRALKDPASMTLGDGVLVLAENEAVRGLGDAGAFLARLREAAAAAGGDPRPHAALGAVLAGRGETTAALAAWREALARGAGPAIAERMARLLRSRLAQPADPAETRQTLEQFADLATHVPGVADELALWRGRLAEAAGDKAAGVAHYAAAARAEDRLLPMPEGLSVSIRMLAEAGQARCAGKPWRLQAEAVLPPSAPVGSWNVPARLRGRAVISGGLVCAFADGLLRGWRLTDGAEAWSRKPQRALLGVQPWPGERVLDGVAIKVLPGSAGDAAGLKDGDVLLKLNGEALKDFEDDLRPRVIALGGGAAFVFVVRGDDGKQREVRGRLGGEPIEPLAADPGIIIARTTMALAPNRSDLRVFAVDPATGADLWAHALSQDEERLARTLPVLIGGMTVAADGLDLIAIARDGTVRWRLSGKADLLAQARPAGRFLWLPGTAGEGVLLDAPSGRELARVPATGDEPPALSATALAVRASDGRVAVWDLGSGRLLSRSAEPARVIALRSDGLLALDGRSRPVVLDVHTGTVRRVLVDAPAELHAIGTTSAYLAIAGPERRSLVAIALDGLSPRWSLDLPPGLEIAGLSPGGNDGLVVELREGARGWGLSLDGRGQPTAVAGWPADPGGGAMPLGEAMLVAEPRALRIQPQGLAKPGQPLRGAILDQGRPLRQACQAGALAWDRAGEPALAVARHGVHLVVAVRIGKAERVLRIADAGGATVLDASRAVAAAGGLRLSVPGAWNLAEQWTTAEPGGTVVWSAWAPSPSRAPGTPLALLLDEREGQPWWLAAGWQRVLDPP